MNVELRVKNWKVKKSDDKNDFGPKICGTYEILMNGNVIGSQDFNDGYSSVNFPFSSDLLDMARDIEAGIVDQIKNLTK